MFFLPNNEEKKILYKTTDSVLIRTTVYFCKAKYILMNNVVLISIPMKSKRVFPFLFSPFLLHLHLFSFKKNIKGVNLILTASVFFISNTVF